MFTVGEKVMRKTGLDVRTGIIVQITKPGEYSKHNGLFVRVAWQNAANRINGNKVTHTTLKDTQLMPYSENAVQFRKRQGAVKQAEKDMKWYYDLFMRATSVEIQLQWAISLAKSEMKYGKLINSPRCSYGICESCTRVRVLECGVCGTCAHRKARSVNTKEMYGHGRRGY